MRVKTQTLKDFLENISTASGVVDSTVWVDTIKNPLDGNRKEAAKWVVEFNAYAVCQIGDGEFLLEMNASCGMDYHDASQDYEGSEKADELKSGLIGRCDEWGLVVRPGTVDMS